MNKFKQAALQVLKESKNPLHYKEITRIAIEKGYLETDGATPDATMNAQLIVDINKLGKASDFIKTDKATYFLNSDRAAIKKVSKKDFENLNEEDEKVKINSSYVGKAGEHLVCSELLFREYNASIMSVDVGMDITATKDNKLFSIQVKTANLNSYNNYIFDVRKVSFERGYSGNVFYIFILRDNSKTDFLILPFSEMEKKVYERAIKEFNKIFRVHISMRDHKIFLGNRNHEMKYYLNNWAIIK